MSANTNAQNVHKRGQTNSTAPNPKRQRTAEEKAMERELRAPEIKEVAFPLRFPSVASQYATNHGFPGTRLSNDITENLDEEQWEWIERTYAVALYHFNEGRFNEAEVFRPLLGYIQQMLRHNGRHEVFEEAIRAEWSEDEMTKAREAQNVTADFPGMPLAVCGERRLREEQLQHVKEEYHEMLDKVTYPDYDLAAQCRVFLIDAQETADCAVLFICLEQLIHQSRA